MNNYSNSSNKDDDDIYNNDEEDADNNMLMMVYGRVFVELLQVFWDCVYIVSDFLPDFWR